MLAVAIWCRSATTQAFAAGKDYLKRDSACLKWATPIVFKYEVKAPDGNIYNPADAHFASAIEIKLDPVSRKFTQRFALVPMDPFIVEHGTIGMPGPATTSNTWQPKGDQRIRHGRRESQRGCQRPDHAVRPW
ncbi:hypothetical protein ACGFXB_44365 [Streptomyces canus]|uniref:hypothetical protein n=1 Tax=Streptomyces canus TaxID=58343 RepID=UPI003724B3FD